MYKIVICVANLKHYDWWKGKPVYQFDTLDEVIRCLKTLFPPNSIKDWEIKRIIDCDVDRQKGNKSENGRIASTSWYEVIRGKEEMTEYTSL